MRSLILSRALKNGFIRAVRDKTLFLTWRRRGVLMSMRAIVKLGHSSRLIIGQGSSIGPYTILDLDNDPVVPPEQAAPSILRIGERTAINEFNNIRAAGGIIEIGNNCLISQFVSIIASNHSIDVAEPMRDAPWERTRNYVLIHNDVWIGTHAVILPGVSIGTGSVVAAGSVVVGDIPEYAIVAGVPAKVKRFRARPAEPEVAEERRRPPGSDEI